MVTFRGVSVVGEKTNRWPRVIDVPAELVAELGGRRQLR